ncbi:MAG: RNA methyltransferase [Propionibacteriaceae bacterium]
MTSYEPIEPDSAGQPLRFASQNQLRSARRLLRRKERSAAELFLAEGPQAVREALAQPELVTAVFVGQSTSARHAALVDTAQHAGLSPVLLSDRDLASLSETVTPQGVVAVSRTLDVELDDALADRPRLVVCCAQVRDPGNAGTVIRCADAFGADAVILTAGSVDAYNAKTVRASAGSLFHLPLVVGTELEVAIDACRARGLQVLAADGSGDVDLDDLTVSGDLAKPTAWLMGNEAWGLPDEQLRLADRVVRVPLYGAAESLNLSTAAAVCLYATASAQRASAL